MKSNILHNLNEIFLFNFPGAENRKKYIIKPDESRFHNQPEETSPEFDIEPDTIIDGYPLDIDGNELSDKLDKLLWEHYNVFNCITDPYRKASEDYTVIFPLIDIIDMVNTDDAPSMVIRSKTSRTELKGDCAFLLFCSVIEALSKQFEQWGINMRDEWWEDTIATRKYLIELSTPKDGTDYDHIIGFYAFNLLNNIDWEEGTKLTDKSIFVYRILCALGLASYQDLLLLDAEPFNGILRKTLAEFIRNRVKSYQNWIGKSTKRLKSKASKNSDFL